MRITVESINNIGKVVHNSPGAYYRHDGSREFESLPRRALPSNASQSPFQQRIIALHFGHATLEVALCYFNRFPANPYEIRDLRDAVFSSLEVEIWLDGWSAADGPMSMIDPI